MIGCLGTPYYPLTIQPCGAEPKAGEAGPRKGPPSPKRGHRADEDGPWSVSALGCLRGPLHQL